VIAKQKKLSVVLVGDVWVCSGQSNMGWGIFQSYPIPSTFPHSAKLRLIKSACPVGKPTPQGEYTIDDHFENSWQRATREYAMQFSAVAYHFGASLTKESNVPVGLIMSAVGGTPIQCWMPENVFKRSPFSQELTEFYKKELACCDIF
jgi:sialate O-acetylesterase